MKVNHVISSIDSASGGTSTCLRGLCQALVAYADISISSISSPNPLKLDPAVEVYLFAKCFGFIPFAFSSKLVDHLREVDTYVFHAHGLWLMPTHYAIISSLNRNISIVISPHGMLEPRALQFSRWKKRLVGWLWQNRDLKRATCIHVTSQMEADNCRKYGLKNPIAIVPNGIELSEYSLKECLATKEHKESQKKGDSNNVQFSTDKKRTLLFLSRIHPKKGLTYLLEAWAQLPQFHDEWQLVIAGNDDGGHEAELKTLATDLGLSWCDQCFFDKELSPVTNNGQQITDNEDVVLYFAGPLFGDDKIKAYQDADLFVLPTLSENFGMVVPEALACGTPVITTKGAPWQELEGSAQVRKCESGQCVSSEVRECASDSTNVLTNSQTNELTTSGRSGWWIDIGTEPLKACLEDALHCSSAELNEMGIRGRKLVEDNYSIDSVAKQMMQVYEWCLEGGIPPECMQFYED